MTNRRVLLTSAASAFMTSALEVRNASASPRETLFAKPLGLQLYSLRHIMEKSVEAGLHKARGLGFTVVEGGVFKGHTAEESRALVQKAGLRMASVFTGFSGWNQDAAKVIATVQAMGATYAVCGSPPHGEHPFTMKECEDTILKFTRWGAAAKTAGLTFAYHIHGFEFEPSPDGTLMDTLITRTPADFVGFEADVFWIVRGGGNPVDLLTKYPGRFPLLHLKDIAKGTAICKPNASAPDETSVPLGTGMIDWPGVLRAAERGGAQQYFIEDENPEAVRQIPKSLAYLRTFKSR